MNDVFEKVCMGMSMETCVFLQVPVVLLVLAAEEGKVKSLFTLAQPERATAREGVIVSVRN